MLTFLLPGCFYFIIAIHQKQKEISMVIYLVQHAKSKSREEDPERPLTDEGLQDIGKMASFAQNNTGITVRKIFHSGKLRARQTAQVLAGSMRPVDGVEKADDRDGGIMLVGHLPHLANLAGVLLSGDQTKNPINFHNAGIIKLIRDSDSIWRIDWIIIPSIIR
jgi:phosphohistidine phosphatase